MNRGTGSRNEPGLHTSPSMLPPEVQVWRFVYVLNQANRCTRCKPCCCTKDIQATSQCTNPFPSSATHKQKKP
jgi:hypothetical protein